jgi:hypothetical protein
MLSCDKDEDNKTAPSTPQGKDINTATKISIDRFSSSAGHLMVRTATNGLPAAGAAINFDQAPFITTGLDKSGASVQYYNFDVQPTTPENIYVFFKSGASAPIAGQNNVIPTIPGEKGYNDFWLVNKVIVPDNYVANTITSEAEVLASGYTVEKTTTVVNCPVVPFGSTANKSHTTGVASSLTIGWYKGQAVAYFNFDEAPLSTVNGLVPTSPIYVMFNDGATGPASGFKTETNNPSQTHNVIATSPGDATYSPLWFVRVIDNANFATVTNLAKAESVASVPADATVNCPVVK